MLRVIDPAVGEGALLLPLIGRLPSRATVVCVDVDSKALATARQRIGGVFAGVPRCIHGDFLKAATSGRQLRGSSFDCVVMNPPYAGKKADWVKVRCESLGITKPVMVPTEIGFALRGVELLKPAGRLLAVLPASTVSSTLFSGIRCSLAAHGQFHYVHELPRFTFQGVEGRVYLVVFERGEATLSTELRNHDLHEPECVSIAWEDLGPQKRLDFGHQASRRWFSELREATSDLGWRPLGEMCTITRGPRKSPFGPRIALHTTDFDGDFWIVKARHRRAIAALRVQSGDLLLARVARRCVRTVGPAVGPFHASWTDCVFRLRPQSSLVSAELLLALRSMFQFKQAADLLERGVGATYLTEADLSAFPVPTKLRDQNGALVVKYGEAAKQANRREMRTLEAKCRGWLLNRLRAARADTIPRPAPTFGERHTSN